MRVREIEELLAMTSLPGLGDQISALAKTIAFHAPNTAIRDLARKLRNEAVDPDTARLRSYVRDLATQLEAARDAPPQDVEPDHEGRIEELEEAVDALTHGYTHVSQELEGSTLLLELLLQHVYGLAKGDFALDLAKSIDRKIEEGLTLRKRDDDRGLLLLRRVRDDLLCWHGLQPAVLKAIADGSVRPIPVRERLQIIEGGPMGQNWHELNIGDKVSALGKIIEMQDAFAKAFAAAGQPSEMAMFQVKNGSHEDAIVLFTPAASAFAASRGATASPAPRYRSDVTLLWGDQQKAWALIPAGGERG